MSLIITLYVDGGIVLASDSRTTQTITKGKSKSIIPATDTAEKTFLAKNGIGISICGAASLNGKPITGAINSFIETFDYGSKKTVLEFCNSFKDHIVNLKLSNVFIAHVAGYDFVEGNYKQSVFRVVVNDDGKSSVNKCNIDGDQGALWDGEAETLRKLIKKQYISSNHIFLESLQITNKDGSQNNISNVYILKQDETTISPECQISWETMSLQDAVDFCRFAINTTINYQRFSSTQKTVGGPIDVLIIKPRQATWLAKKELK